MPDQGIKSRPVYRPLSLDAEGRRHLLVLDSPTAPSSAFAEGASVDGFPELWRIERRSTAIPTAGVGAQPFRSEPHLLAALRRRLSDERMGFRLYAIGAEPFLWAVHAVAAEHDLGPDEIRMFATGDGARRVFCNHCRTINEGVTTNIVPCSGCGAHLFVRDHFSRRLNAFAGVQVDAEAPGEIPPIEEMYR